jgi:hypothetical protein
LRERSSSLAWMAEFTRPIVAQIDDCSTEASGFELL